MDKSSSFDELVTDTIARIGKAAKAGDLQGTREIIADLVGRQPSESPIESHRARLEAIGSDTGAICRYLGELGIAVDVVTARIGHEMTSEEFGAYQGGRNERILEARALELAEARRTGKVRDWMLK